jgi:type IX secretion system PorP/SprF family membrane protein
MNYIIKIKLVLLFALLFATTGWSQTFHFSQFHAVPMALNPALTGDMKGPYRFSANFRSQWVNGGTPYLTGALGADFHLLKKQIPEGSKWGLGFNILNDQSNGGGLQNTEISLSSAYHIKVDEFGDQTFGLGFQGTYHERKINLSVLNFEDQFTDQGFINSLPTGEIFTDVNKKYFDINAGLIYNYRDPESGLQLFAGVSAYNLLQSKVAFTNLQNYHLPSRYTEHAGGIIPVSQLSDIKFSATYMQMANATNLTVGAAWDYSLDIESATSIILGSWYRVDDAIIPYVGFRSNSFQLGLTYDATSSTLKTLSQSRNAYELSFVYMPWNGNNQKGPNWY